MDHPDRLNILIGTLDIFAAVRILIAILIYRNQKIAIGYQTITSGVRVFFSTLSKFGYQIELNRFYLDYTASIRTGGAIWYWNHEVIINVSKKLTEMLENAGGFVGRISKNIAKERSQACLRQKIAAELYVPVAQALFAEEKIKETGGQFWVCLPFADLSPFIVNELKPWIQRVHFLRVPVMRNSVFLRIFVFLAAQGSLLIKYIFCKGWLIKPKASDSEMRVAIQYSRDIDAQLNDLWWFNETGLSPNRAVLFFNRGKKSPATDALISKIEQRGHLTAILDKDSNQSSRPVDGYEARRVAYLVEDFLVFGKFLVEMPFLPAARWQLSRWLGLVLSVRSMQAFFEIENIKVVMDTAETNTDYAALAADIAGALKVGTHWSDLSFPRSQVVPIQHVYGVWGPLYADVFIEQMGAASEVVFTIGNLFDQTKNRSELMIKGNKHRQKFHDNNIRRIVAVLDRSCSWDGFIPPPYHQEFFDKIINWAESDPELGLIIKYKDVGKPRFFNEEGASGVAAKINALEQQGRIICLDGTAHVLEAGYASDIVITFGPAASAGILCAFAGMRSVFWDPTAASEGPFKELVNNEGWSNPKITYSDLDQLIKDLDVYLDDPQSNTQIGNLSKMITKLDGFRDGKAGMRMGEYVKIVLEEMKNGISLKESFNRANLHYSNIWGLKIYGRTKD